MATICSRASPRPSRPGAGPDIIFMLHNWPHLYAGVARRRERSLRVEGQGPGRLLRAIRGRGARRQAAGSPCPTASWATRWPIGSRGSPRSGATQPPKTLDEWRKIGAALKKKGKPIGQTLGHTYGDAPTFSYPARYGPSAGAETDKSGKKVVLNCRATVEAVKWMVRVLEGRLRRGRRSAWDDTIEQPRLPRRVSSARR